MVNDQLFSAVSGVRRFLLEMPEVSDVGPFRVLRDRNGNSAHVRFTPIASVPRTSSEVRFVPNLLGFYRFIVLLLVLVGSVGERCLLRSHLSLSASQRPGPKLMEIRHQLTRAGL